MKRIEIYVRLNYHSRSCITSKEIRELSSALCSSTVLNANSKRIFLEVSVVLPLRESNFMILIIVFRNLIFSILIIVKRYR